MMSLVQTTSPCWSCKCWVSSAESALPFKSLSAPKHPSTPSWLLAMVWGSSQACWSSTVSLAPYLGYGKWAMQMWIKTCHLSDANHHAKVSRVWGVPPNVHCSLKHGALQLVPKPCGYQEACGSMHLTFHPHALSSYRKPDPPVR